MAANLQTGDKSILEKLSEAGFTTKANPKAHAEQLRNAADALKTAIDAEVLDSNTLTQAEKLVHAALERFDDYVFTNKNGRYIPAGLSILDYDERKRGAGESGHIYKKRLRDAAIHKLETTFPNAAERFERAPAEGDPWGKSFIRGPLQNFVSHPIFSGRQMKKTLPKASA